MQFRILSAFCFFACCYSFAVAAPTDNDPLELLKDAADSCFSEVLPHFVDWHNYTAKYEGRMYCPLECFASKTGIINDNGLNKIAVDWVRGMFDTGSNDTDMQLIRFFSAVDLNETKYATEAFLKFSTYHSEVKKACSVNNEDARDKILKALSNYLKSYSDALELEYTASNGTILQNQDKFQPSEESSPILESIEVAQQHCTPKFNTTMSSVLLDLAAKKRTTASICSSLCMAEELKFVVKVNDKDEFNPNLVNYVWQNVVKPIKPEATWEKVNEMMNSHLLAIKTEYTCV